MLPFRWGLLLGVALLIAFAHGASISSAVNDGNIGNPDRLRRFKRSYKRGQTQSQYLNFGQPELDGKAEAEATDSGSRSTVSGTHGMGQAQSQFSSGDCSGCGVGGPVYEYSTGSPDPLTLGGNDISYSDGKPSSIIGLPRTTAGKPFGPGAGTSGTFSPSTGNRGGGGPGAGAGGGSAPVVGGTFAPGTVGQVGRPDAGGNLIPSDGGIFGPGAGGTLTPGSGGTYTPGIGGQEGRPGAGREFVPSSDGSFGPGSGGTYAPVAGATRQFGAPGTSFDPRYGPAASSNGIGQQGAPGLAPGHLGQPSIRNDFPSASGTPGAGGSYSPSTGSTGQIGAPGTAFAPSYGSGSGVGQQESPSIGRLGQPGVRTDFAPGRDVAGAPGTGGSGPAGHIGTPGTSFGANYGPGAGSGGIEQQGAPGIGVSPGQPSFRSDFAPGTGVAGVPGTGGTVSSYPGGAPQRGAPGTSFYPNYGPSSISGGVGQQGATGQQPATVFGPQVPAYRHGPGVQMPTYTSGASNIQPEAGGQQVPTHGTEGRRPTGVTGQPGQQNPSYGYPGQQVSGQPINQSGSIYRPSSSPSQQPVQQYGTDQQVVGYPQQPVSGPSYGGQIPRGGESRGGGFKPETQYTGTAPQQILQGPGAGTITRPGANGFQQGAGGGLGQTAGVGIGQQPGSGLQPGYRTQHSGGYGQPETGIQPGQTAGVGIDQQPDSGLPSGYRTQPSRGYGQPGTGIQPGQTAGIGIGQQPGSGLQPGYRTQPSGGYGQPGTGIQSGLENGYQSGVGGFTQPGSGVQPSTGYVQPGAYGQPGAGIQQGRTYGQPGTGSGISHGVGVGQQGKTGGLQPSAGFVQKEDSYQPDSWAFGPQGGKSGTVIQPTHPGIPQMSSYSPGYGPQAVGVQQGTGNGFAQRPQIGRQDGGGYIPGMTYGQPGYDQQSGIRPSQGSVQPSVGTQAGLQQPGQTGLGVQPNAGFEQPVGGQSGGGQQAGTQPGAGIVQYPPAGFSQPGAGFAPLPARGAQHGTGVQQGAYEQGSGIGTGYDTTFSQQPGGQRGTGYGQPSGPSQYGQRGYGTHETGIQPGRQPIGTETQYPATGVAQYGQGPQQILEPGATYIPRGVPPSGVQQGIAGSGGLAAGAGGSDDAFSQAESSIGNGQAAASAQGKKNGGTAKTQVQGTYSSSGSFSASAMTSDNDRSASSQVTGGVEGAMSQSQGQGGAAQSQAQVQVNEKTGGTKASSQSGGIIHQSQSEVQANDKGGLADAQSSGPGQTSSQAQIGFRPGQDGEIVRSVGGGQAAAQSGVHSGNSQSQIQGTSKFGVSYHGAAQSASGTKEQVATYREQNRDLFNTISQFGSSDAVTDRVDTVYNPALTSESDIPDLQLKASRTNKDVTNSNKLDDDSVLLNEDEEEEPFDEYEDEEDYYNENPIKMESKTEEQDKKLESPSGYRTHTQKSPTQTQQVAVADPNKKYNVVQNQNGRIQKHSGRTTTEIVPSGFRGTVNVEKKFHTKSLEPHKSEEKLNITAEEKSEYNPRTPDSFVTVTKSITGSMDNSKNPPQDNKNFQSTFYTKSSTCGYFTFSCNIVYGANGRSKICRPKAPTNGKC